MHNHRGILPISRNHFTAVVALNGAVVEALMDTGGARSMIDFKTATAMGLPVELASESRHFGCFWGPTGTPVNYKGRISGPVTVRFDSEVAIQIAEFKVVEGEEPLVLLGADMMAPAHVRKNTWEFEYIGLDQHNRAGVMRFVKDGRGKVVKLVAWPTERPGPTHAASTKTAAKRAPPPPPPKPLALSTQEQCADAKALAALIISRGQRL